MTPKSTSQSIFSEEETIQARRATEALRDLLYQHAQTDDPERVSVEDRIREAVRSAPNNILVDGAHRILDAQQSLLRAEFVEATKPFFGDSERASKAAESTDKFRILQQQERFISETPTLEIAEFLLALFQSAEPALEDGADPLKAPFPKE